MGKTAFIFGAGGGSSNADCPPAVVGLECKRHPADGLLRQYAAGGILSPDGFSSLPAPPKQKDRTRRSFRFGAGGGTRTHTVSLPTDFESVTSAIPSHRRLFSCNIYIIAERKAKCKKNLWKDGQRKTLFAVFLRFCGKRSIINLILSKKDAGTYER